MQTEITKIKDPIDRLFAFARERHAIYQRRAAGKNPPWTEDEILREYRFCNVYRELDKVTTWIRDNWRTPNNDDPDLWFAMCVARLFNQPESLAVIGYPVPFDLVKFSRKIVNHKRAGGKCFNAAYIVSTAGFTMDKIAYVSHNVLTPLWKGRERLRPTENDTLNSYHMNLGQMQGFGSFMSAQVVADIKYHPPLDNAKDWETFAASGPGSRRGLNYVLGRARKDPWEEDKWRLELGRLREQLLPMFARAKMPKPHAQDIQNLLCEWSKYWRAATEEKMPKQKYRWENEK
jgi:5-hmdU DNA kinase, helical domain